MSYKNLEVWKIARDLVIDIHHLTLKNLPAFEMYEEGGQIRRPIKSVNSNLVEGYGRRRYKQEFIRFLVYALASCDESIDHLETLWETKSLTDESLFQNLHKKLETLGKKMNLLIQSVEKGHMSPK
jgi:four helix bundle protein